jgi:hypothetical protein
MRALKLDAAVAFYSRELAHEPKFVGAVDSSAEIEGFTADTLRRARRKLGIKARAIKGFMPPVWEYPALDEDLF